MILRCYLNRQHLSSLRARVKPERGNPLRIAKKSTRLPRITNAILAMTGKEWLPRVANFSKGKSRNDKQKTHNDTKTKTNKIRRIYEQKPKN